MLIPLLIFILVAGGIVGAYVAMKIGRAHV